MPNRAPRLYHPAELAPSSPPRVVDEQRIVGVDGSVTHVVLEEHRDHYAVVERREFARDAVAAHRAFVARVATLLLPEMAAVAGDDDAPSWTPPAPSGFAPAAEVRP